MSRTRAVVLPMLLFLFCASTLAAKSAYTPKANTRAGVKEYVNRAAKVVASKGAACDTFKGSRWMAGDWYVFVIGPDNRVVCHPKADMVGKLNTEIVDANGKNVGEALAAAAKSKEGEGWVEYFWPRPGQTKPEPKSSYVVRVTGKDGKAYIVGSGGYGLK